MKKKISVIVLSLVMVLLLVPGSVFAVEQVTDAKSLTVTSATTDENIAAAWGEGAATISANNDGTYTFKLLKDISFGKSRQLFIGNYDAGRDQPRIIIDLNGCKLSGTSIVVANYGNLTITDRSTYKTGEIAYTKTDGTVCAVQNSGYSLIVDGGTVSSASSSLYSCAVNTAASENGTCTTTINGGTFNCEGTSAIISSGETVINGSEINAKYGVVSKMATWNGALQPDIEIPAESTVEVNTSSFAVIVWAKSSGSDETGNIDIAGGTFNIKADKLLGMVSKPDSAAANKSTTVTGGIYTVDPSAYVPEGNSSVRLDGFQGSNTTFERKRTTFAVGKASIKTVLDNAAAGDTVTVLSAGKNTAINVLDQVMVINKSGEEITVNNQTLENNEEITAHTFSKEWTYDETNHLHKCTECGEKADASAHTFKWITDKEATASEKGFKHEECTICGYKKNAVEIPAMGSTIYSADTNGDMPSNDERTEDSTGKNETTYERASAQTQTGDSFNLAFWVMLAIAAFGAALCIVFYSGKRKRNEKE